MTQDREPVTLFVGEGEELTIASTAPTMRVRISPDVRAEVEREAVQRVADWVEERSGSVLANWIRREFLPPHDNAPEEPDA